MFFSAKKLVRFSYSCLRSCFVPTPVFLRVIPTDRCNLQCQYCYQNNPNSPTMSRKEFDEVLAKAKQSGTSIISFLGGEPLVWPDIYYAVEQCSRQGVMTTITTNATLLTEENFEKLGKAGLDFLEVSVDSLLSTEQSEKSFVADKELSARMRRFAKRHKVVTSVNMVVSRDNIESAEELIDFTHYQGYPLSIGFIVPPPGQEQEWEGSHLAFTEADFPALEAFTAMVLSKKRQGYKIIEPPSYFQGIFDFVQGKHCWDCGSHRKKFSGITVAPDGRLRTCTKLMDSTEHCFLDLTPRKIREVRASTRAIISQCNPRCYSNCAYNAFYYTRHKWQFLFQQLFPALVKTKNPPKQ